MKTLTTIFTVLCFFNFSISSAQAVVPEKDLESKTFLEVFDYLGLPSSYGERYSVVILPLYEQGIILFDCSLNPHEDGGVSPNCYIGTVEQNQKLVRNLIANRHLIKDGKLVPTAGERWKVIE